MFVCGSWGAVRPSFFLAAVIAVVSPLTSGGEEKSSLRAEEPSPATDLFAAIDAEDVKVTVIPRDDTRLTMQVENKSDRPLTIQLPEAFAAVPVLAQFAPFPLNGGNQANNRNRGGQAQQLGVGNNQQGQGQGQGPFQRGFFNVPAGKVVKLRLPCVCLEYGKPTPSSRMSYEVRPIESIVDGPEVAATLAAMSRGEISRRVAQAAAWHYANDKSWQELASLRIRHIGGISDPRFSVEEVARARKFAEGMAEQREEKVTVSQSRSEPR
jgi:hypothetical protein